MTLLTMWGLLKNDPIHISFDSRLCNSNQLGGHIGTVKTADDMHFANEALSCV